MANFVRFIRKSKTDYNNIDNKDTNAIYFVNGEGNVNQIYLGSDLYGADIINSYTDIANNKSVYSTTASNSMIAGKADMCTLRTYSDTTLPEILNISNNTEYRYTALTNATGLNISITDAPVNQDTWMFYSSIVLNKISTTLSLDEFITMDSSSSINDIIFLNKDIVILDDMDVLEVLFFANGMSNQVCCIGYAYKLPVPPNP